MQLFAASPRVPVAFNAFVSLIRVVLSEPRDSCLAMLSPYSNYGLLDTFAALPVDDLYLVAFAAFMESSDLWDCMAFATSVRIRLRCTALRSGWNCSL